MHLNKKHRANDFLVIPTCLVLMMGSLPTNSVLAQGAPSWSGCGGDPTQVGPCVGPNSWNGGVGMGCGKCGQAEDVVYTFTGGTCQGYTPGPYGTNNCTTCTAPTQQIDGYVSLPRSTLAFAACVSAATAGAIGLTGVACILSCCGITGFTTAGFGTCAGGACFGICGVLVGGLSGAALAEILGCCEFYCQYTGSSTGGSTTACSGP